MQPRLTAGLRVAALLRRCDQAGRAAYVVRRGDDTAGAIALSIVRPSGTAELWAQEYDWDSDSRRWVLQVDGPPRDIDAAAARRGAADPDLWLIELELSDDMSPSDLID